MALYQLSQGDNKMKKILWTALLFFVFGGQTAVAGTYDTFPIPGAFPGTFFIDFLATQFLLNSTPAGTLSSNSQILFDVVGPPTGDIWQIVVAPEQFQFVGFSPAFSNGASVFGAGTGTGTFNVASGDWSLDMPTMFLVDSSSSYTKIDLHFTTGDPGMISNVPSGVLPGSPMVLDTENPAWGNLDIVAAGFIMQTPTLAYDDALVSSILNNNPTYTTNGNWAFSNLPYEFRVHGHDPIASVPEPGSLTLVVSAMVGLFAAFRRSA